VCGRLCAIAMGGLILLLQDPPDRALRSQIAACACDFRNDLLGGQIAVLGLVDQVHYGLFLFVCKLVRRLRVWATTLVFGVGRAAPSLMTAH